MRVKAGRHVSDMLACAMCEWAFPSAWPLSMWRRHYQPPAGPSEPSSAPAMVSSSCLLGETACPLWLFGSTDLWNRRWGRRWGRSRERSWGRSRERSWGRSRERSWGRSRERSCDWDDRDGNCDCWSKYCRGSGAAVRACHGIFNE
jgi:hypothetical protein